MQFKKGDSFTQGELRITIQRLRSDYYETLEENTRTGERTNKERKESFLEGFNSPTSLNKGTKE
jgi:hypothetical protein